MSRSTTNTLITLVNNLPYIVGKFCLLTGLLYVLTCNVKCILKIILPKAIFYDEEHRC